MTRFLLALFALASLAACPGTMEIPTAPDGASTSPHIGGGGASAPSIGRPTPISPSLGGGPTGPTGSTGPSGSGGDDGGMQPASTSPDLAMPSSTGVDMATPAAAVDMATPHPPVVDMATPPPPPAGDMAMRPVDMAVPRDLAPPPVTAAHRRCGWIGAGDLNGYATFAANAAWFDVIHPDWYAINSDSVTIRAIEGEGNSTLLAAAAAHNIPIIPLIAGVEDVTWVRGMISSASNRAAHIQNLVNLAVSKGYAGVDIDYEHLWNAGDQANFTTFMTQLATAMHAVGKQVSVAAEGLDAADPSSAWDYSALGKVLDNVHIMGYDYHTLGTHSGPCAPLGWIDAVSAHAASTGYGSKFILGVPNYGTTPTWYCASADCITSCGSSYVATTTEMQSCAFNIDTHYAAGRAPHCDTANGTLYFDDTQSLAEKVNSAKSHGLGGITYWTVGSEPSGFFDMVKQYY